MDRSCFNQGYLFVWGFTHFESRMLGDLEYSPALNRYLRWEKPQRRPVEDVPPLDT